MHDDAGFARKESVASADGGGTAIGSTVLHPIGANAARLSGAARQYRAFVAGVVASDAAVVLASILGAFTLMRGGVSPIDVAIAVPATIAYLIAFGLAHLYDFQTTWPAEELKRILIIVPAMAGLISATSFWAGRAMPRAWLALSAGFLLVGLLATRRLWHFLLFLGRVRGRFRSRTLVVGSGGQAARLVRWMRAPAEGFLPIGVVRTDGMTDPVEGMPVVGDVESLAQAIRHTGSEALFLPSNALPPESMSALLRTARLESVAVWVVPNLEDILASRIAPRAFGPGVALGVRPARLSGWQAMVKRGIDVVGSLILLACLAPVAVLVAVAVRLDSPGPALFRQVRTTRRGRPFTMYKFRTMAVDRDRIVERLGIDSSSPFFKLHEDPRVTRVGRVLRRTSLDEIPQLVNVLKGDMSLVGPRPLPVDQVRRQPSALEHRHEVRAGLTGWWQIRGRSSVDAQSALRMDAFYIENWSPALDLYILAKTLGTVLRGTGAR